MSDHKLSEAFGPWPKDHHWNIDVGTFAAVVQSAAEEHWWGFDSQLKYLDIRVDTRDGCFIVKDRDGEVVSPDRVLKAIDEHRTSGRGRKLFDLKEHPAGRSALSSGESA